jgi:hypothetical protein
VRLDPRVSVAAGALARQFGVASRLVQALRRDSTALDHARDLRRQLHSAHEQAAAGALAATLDSLEREAGALDGGPGGSPSAGGQPQVGLARLNGQLAELYGVVEGADVAPTAQAEALARDLERHLVALEARGRALAGRFRSVTRGLQ